MKVNLVFLLGVSLFAFAVGAPNCANPCADLWVAKDCNKVQYCIQNDWSRLKPTGNTDDVCDICLRMVKEARDTLQSKELQDDIKQVFEGSCKLLVVKPIVDACDKLADQFVSEFVALLSSQMDPETVCTVAKLCNNNMLREMLKNSKRCTNCQRFMLGAKENMKSISEEEYKEGLLSLCRNAGSFTDACYGVTQMYSDLLYNHTKAALNNSPCESTLLCPSGAAAEETTANDKCSNSVQKRMCPMCVAVTGDIIEQLTRTKSVDDYRQNFIKICTRLSFPGDICSKAAESSRMHSFLKDNGESVSRFFCRRTICGEKRSEEIPVWPLLPVQLSKMSMEETEDVILKLLIDFIRDDSEEHIRSDMAPEIEEMTSCAESNTNVAAVNCPTCELTLKKMLQVVEDNEKEYAAKEPLMRICDKLPTKSGVKCLSMINDHDQEVRDVISGQISPEKACNKMKYCSEELKVAPRKKISYGDPIENPTFFAPYLLKPVYESDCKLCKDLSHILSDYVNTNNTYMKQALGVACLLSSNLGRCSNFIESYSPEIATNFAEYVSSEKVCEDVIPLCHGKESHVTVQKSDSKENCENCKTWVEGVTSILLDEKNLEMIRATFGMSCEKLPEERREHCRHVVKRYGENMLSSILDRLSPDEACGNLNYCEKKNTGMDASPPASTTTSTLSTSLQEIDLDKVPCKFCLIAVKTLLDQLENEKTEAAIRRALKNLCNYFPEETRHTCQNLIEEYAEDLVDMIIADFNPSEICTKLRICKPTNNNVTWSQNKEISIQTFDIKTNEIRDDNEIDRFTGSASRVPEMESSSLLQKVHSAVQECAMCEALVQVISTHKKMLVKDYDFSGNSSAICKIVPRHKKKQCMSMVVSYGPSIVNLIVDKKVKPDDVCLELTLCDPTMNAKINMPVSVVEPKPGAETNDCFKGPSFWCANEENARKCGTYLHCREMVWKTEKTLN